MPRTFYIIDGHSQIYRAFFAQAPPLRSPDGEPTKATYVFTRGLLKLLREHKPTFIAMACDSGREHLHRRKVYRKYKSERKGMPPELLVQVARIKHIVAGLGIPVLHAKGWEADDIVATLVDCCAGLDIDVVIVSRDKDLMQLVGRHVKMYDPMREEWVDKRAVIKKWGVPPKRVVEVQILCGDSTDGVPGIKGIGPITAAMMIKEYGSALNVLKENDAEDNHLPTRVVKAIDGCMAWLVCARNRKLVSLCRNVPLDIDVSSLRWRGLDLGKVRPIFRTLGFKRWE